MTQFIFKSNNALLWVPFFTRLNVPNTQTITLEAMWSFSYEHPMLFPSCFGQWVRFNIIRQEAERLTWGLDNIVSSNKEATPKSRKTVFSMEVDVESNQPEKLLLRSTCKHCCGTH
jgi:hypothetical protein